MDNSIYGKTKVEVPFLEAVHGELEEPVNATCPVCGKSAHHTSACPKYGHMAICDAHCESCHFYKKPYGCQYKARPP